MPGFFEKGICPSTTVHSLDRGSRKKSGWFSAASPCRVDSIQSHHTCPFENWEQLLEGERDVKHRVEIMNMWLRTFFAYLWCWVSFFHGHSWHLCWFRTTDRPCIFNLVWTCNRHILSEINLSSTSSEWPERKDNRGPKSCAFVCCYCWYNTSHHWYKVELHTSFVTTMYRASDIDDQTIRVTMPRMCEKWLEYGRTLTDRSCSIN